MYSQILVSHCADNVLTPTSIAAEAASPLADPPLSNDDAAAAAAADDDAADDAAAADDDDEEEEVLCDRAIRDLSGAAATAK